MTKKPKKIKLTKAEKAEAKAMLARVEEAAENRRYWSSKPPWAGP